MIVLIDTEDEVAAGELPIPLMRAVQPDAVAAMADAIEAFVTHPTPGMQLAMIARDTFLRAVEAAP